jgi:hypothetical protein
MAETLLSALSQPFQMLRFLGQARESSPSPTRKDSVPSSWICHDCAYLLPTESAITEFRYSHCHGCGHERCGMCDIVFVEKHHGRDIKTVGVVAPNTGTSDHMMFHYDTSDAEAAAQVVEEVH